jgi:hypothetical protein
MANSKEYAYYIKGNNIAVVERDRNDTSGLTSPSSVPSIDLPNSLAKWKSPQSDVSDGIELEYVYTPIYTFPEVVTWAQQKGDITKVYYNGWIVVDGYLTFVRTGTVWSTFSKFDVNDTIYIGGSGRWNGVHKIQEIQDAGDVKHGGIKTFTRVTDTQGSLFDPSATWNTDETISTIQALAISNAFTSSDATPNLWIMGSDADAGNNGLFSGSWTIEGAGTTLNLAAAKRLSFSTDVTYWDETAPGFTSDSSEDIYIYEAHKDPGAFIITDVQTLTDESDDIDVPSYLAKALVYYVKAKIAEDQLEVDLAELWMAKFRKIVEKHESSKVPGPRRVMPGTGSII